jgi:hypothetical protein
MRRRALPLLVSLFLLFVATSLWAQFAQRGALAGSVFDSSGAVVPAAQVTLLDLGQNQSRNMKTDSAGHFEFDNLAAGQYQLTAVVQGFETQKSQSISVNIGAVAHYDFKLTPGSEQQTVTVSAEAGGLETDQTSLSTNITARQFEDLPLNGRNFTAVAALVPGVATIPQPNINPGGTYSVGAMFAFGGTQFQTGGSFQGSRDNGFYINGVNVNDNYESSISFAPSTEAMSTGTVNVSEFSAASGRDLSTLTMQTKGGSRQFHGEGFEFLENDDLNAFNPYDKASEIITGQPVTKPTIKRNQFGGNLGGPVFIPKLLPNLRNRAFFFANYENLLEHDGAQPVQTSVPSAAERAGDFSELLCTNPKFNNSQCAPTQLYNPYLTTYDASGNSSRPAIPGNRLDLARKPDGTPVIDPASAAYLALWPLPNLPNVPSSEVNYVATTAPSLSNYHIDTRFDATITSKDSAFVTWSKSIGSSQISGGIPPGQLHNFPNTDHGFLVTANYVHVFTPHLTNEFIFGFGDSFLLAAGNLNYFNSDANPLNHLFQNTGTGITKGSFAVNTGSNYATIGANESFRAENQSLQFSDNVDWVLGRHTLAAGFNYLRKIEQDWDFARNVSFGTNAVDYPLAVNTQAFSAGGFAQNYIGGDGIADLEMGTPSDMQPRYTITGGDATAPDPPRISPYWGFYVNDKFRVSPKLTVSAGLRYDLSLPLYTPNPHSGPCCQIYTSTPQGGILQIPGLAPGLPQRYLTAHKLNFAPRVSFAYSPNPRTAIRGGYGIFFDTGATQLSGQQGQGVSGAVNYDVSNVSLGKPKDTPFLTLGNIFPAPKSTALGTYPVSTGPGQGYLGDLSTGNAWNFVQYFDKKSFSLPYYQRMLFDIQRQIGPRDVFTLSYAGAQGRKGLDTENINLPPYQTGWINGAGADAYNAARPNNSSRFGDIEVWRGKDNSFYNALIVLYRHDFTNGLQFSSNYTWGKTVSDYPYTNILNLNTNGGADGFQYPNIRSRGEATFSHRNRFVFTGIWGPLYGASWPAFAKIPLTGWRVSGIFTLESGDALTVSNGGSGNCLPDGVTCGTSANDGAGMDELFVSGDPNLSHGAKTFSRQFDTSKFTIPTQNVRGNSGLGTIRGPGQNNLDLSLAKTFPIYESLHVEFRADAFNALNHTQWNGLNTTYPSGNPQFPFGSVSGAREARIGQVGAKVVF